jgi:riboflavin synthase
MFTGIVEELGSFVTNDQYRYRFGAETVLDDVELGASIAVNGCCLTVVAWGEGWWEADLSQETLDRTALGDLRSGSSVNFERSVRLMDRMGGHLVQGHVDAVGRVIEVVPDLRVQAPPDVVRYLVEKGSITVDGVSLTVVEALADGFTVAVIPHTSAVTTLGARRVGDRVNLEIDVIAKYVERLVSPHDVGPGQRDGGIDS